MATPRAADFILSLITLWVLGEQTKQLNLCVSYEESTLSLSLSVYNNDLLRCGECYLYYLSTPHKQAIVIFAH